MTDTMEIIRGK